jgi:radical SAM superfamily enzyme YgiQ (UPF0313 family)
VRVLLVHPVEGSHLDRVVRLPPLGLAYIAGVLRRAGHEAKILDAAVTRRWREELGKILTAWQPQAVGITASTAGLEPARALAAALRESDPRLPVILGGVHATLFPAEVLEDSAFSFAVHGEGEQTIVELVAALERSDAPDGIAGIAYRHGGRPRVNARRALIEDLDGLPFPAYDLLPLGRYATPFSATRAVACMITSRGCPYFCTFCDASVVHGRKYRAHSAERVVEEMTHLALRFGIREVVFKDSEFTLDRARTSRICDLLAGSGVRVSWTCSARVDRVDGPLLRRMAGAGCRVVQFGVESGDPEVLRALKKRITIEQIRAAFSWARDAGIATVANLMVGLPGETWRSIELTRSLIREIRPEHLNVQVLVPYPGTELGEELKWRQKGADNAISGAAPELPAPNEARRRRATLIRSFYLRPRQLLGRVLTLNPVRWRENLAAAHILR